jgi:aryl-alcohol dehydrogenase-like predicted oxidoreductase
LAFGALLKSGSVLADTARRLGATASQVALAWMLKRSNVILPIPGTASPDHLLENVRGAELSLSDGDFAALGREGAS